MPNNNCATESLAPYQGNWTEVEIRHLLRKIGYGGTETEISNALLSSPEAFIDSLIDTANGQILVDEPTWSNWTREDYENDPNEDLQFEHFESLRDGWIERSFSSPLLTKISIFWHDHFSTEYDVYRCNNYLWQYFNLIQTNALGNFRSFVENMGLSGAMLSYLNGNSNIAEEPNENYARELMELFTMGEGNGYTQTDIEEMARALTGYRANMYQCTVPYFDNDYHDQNSKVIFNQTGNFNYADVHELIFTLRKSETATYICQKLYQQFVYFTPNQNVVQELAQTFIDSNWEIIPVLKKLLKSEHFFDKSFFGSQIKNPLETLLNLLRPINLDLENDVEEDFISYIEYASRRMGMSIFNPPNVAGWPGHRTWLSENALTFRWTFSTTLIRGYLNDNGKEKLRSLALSQSEESNDPAIIVSKLAQFFLSSELDNELLEIGILHLKEGIPENYFLDGSWNLYWSEAPDQIINLLSYFIQLPEFQLA